MKKLLLPLTIALLGMTQLSVKAYVEPYPRPIDLENIETMPIEIKEDEREQTPYSETYNTVKKWTKIPSATFKIDTSIDTKRIFNYAKDKVFKFIADQINADGYISQLHQDLSSIVGEIQTFLDPLGIDIEVGNVGLPNIQQVKVALNEATVLEEIDNIFNTQTGSSYSNKERLYQQYLSSLASNYSENSSLSLAGQSKLEAKIDSAISASEQSLSIAKDSSSQDVSQNILRNISNQLALDQQLNAMEISEYQDDKINSSLSTMLTSEVLNEMQKSNVYNERYINASNSLGYNSSLLISIPGNK